MNYPKTDTLFMQWSNGCLAGAADRCTSYWDRFRLIKVSGVIVTVHCMFLFSGHWNSFVFQSELLWLHLKRVYTSSRFSPSMGSYYSSLLGKDNFALIVCFIVQNFFPRGRISNIPSNWPTLSRSSLPGLSWSVIFMLPKCWGVKQNAGNLKHLSCNQ